MKFQQKDPSILIIGIWPIPFSWLTWSTLEIQDLIYSTKPANRTSIHQPLPAPLTANKSLSNPSNNGPTWPTIPSPLLAQPEGPDHHKTPPRVANLRLSISPIKRQNHKALLVVPNGSSQRLLCLRSPTKASLLFLSLPLSYAPCRHTTPAYSFSPTVHDTVRYAPKAHVSFSKSDCVFGRMGL